MSVTICSDSVNGGTAIPANGIDLGPGRRRVTQQDLNMYQALVGVQQTVAPPVEPARVTDPLDPDDGDESNPRRFAASRNWKRAPTGLSGGMVDPTLVSIPQSNGEHRGRPAPQPWSPVTLCMNIADYCDDLSVRIRRPQLSAWVKRLSQQARSQIARVQTRFASPWDR